MGRRKKLTKSDINFFAYLVIFIIAVVVAVIRFVFVGICYFISFIWNFIKSFEDSLIRDYGSVTARKIFICALIISAGCIIILLILLSEHIKAVKQKNRIKRETARLEALRQEECKKQEAEERECERLRKEYQYGYREDMTGYEYEQYCADLFRYFSWTARATKKSGDFGADVIAEKNGIKIVAQCKKWNGSVGFDAVKEIFTAKAFYEADYAFVITNSNFSSAAKRASKNIGVILIRHPDLEDCLRNLLLYEKSR